MILVLISYNSDSYIKFIDTVSYHIFTLFDL